MTDILTIDCVSRHFGGLRAVDEVSFGLPPNSLSALIGPNGAGKTTLFNVIAGALPATAGRVMFGGMAVRDATGACGLGIARTFQNVRLFGELSLLENVMVGMGGAGFLRNSLRRRGDLEAERLRLKAAYYLLDDLGLAESAALPARELPFGLQRLAEIARALATKPRLLLLDEPAAGLNRAEKAALARLIRRLHERGLTILLVEHDMPLVMNLVERVVVLDSGRLIADGVPAAVCADPRVRAAYLGVPDAALAAGAPC